MSPLQGGGHLNPGSCLHGAAPRALLNNSISTVYSGHSAETLRVKVSSFSRFHDRGCFPPAPGARGDQSQCSRGGGITRSPRHPRHLTLNILSCSGPHTPLRLMITTNFRPQTNKLQPPLRGNVVHSPDLLDFIAIGSEIISQYWVTSSIAGSVLKAWLGFDTLS